MNIRLPVLMTTLILVVSAIVMPARVSASGKADVSWGEPRAVYTPKSFGAFYPRPLLLSDGSILVAFDSDEGSYGIPKVKVIRSTDEGKTWSPPVLVMEQTNVTCATPQLFEAKDGTIWCSFRMSWKEGNDTLTRICVKTSADKGASWIEMPNGFLVDEARTIGRFGGLWEPHVGYAGDDIVMMYCDDSPRIGTSGSYQYILLKRWQGSGWSESSLVSGFDLSRDGMPVWIHMQDGRYLVVFESTDVQPSVFGIKYELSPDGLDWSGDRLEVDTPAVGRVENAPYVVQLEDGRLLCAFQSDTDNKVRLGVNASSAYAIEGWIAGDRIDWGERYRLFPVADTLWSTMASLLPLPGGRVLAFCTSNSPGMSLYVKEGTYGAAATKNPNPTEALEPTGATTPHPTKPGEGTGTTSPWLIPGILGLLVILGAGFAGVLTRRQNK